MCVGQRCGYHRCGPRGAGVYAAQHAPGRECVSCGSTAGRHVPAPRDGKKAITMLFYQPVKIFWLIAGSVASHKNNGFLLVFLTRQPERQADTQTTSPLFVFKFQLPLIL